MDEKESKISNKDWETEKEEALNSLLKETIEKRIKARKILENKQIAADLLLKREASKKKFLGELKTCVVELVALCPCKKKVPVNITWSRGTQSLEIDGIQNFAGTATCSCGRHLVYGLSYLHNSSKILESDSTLAKASKLGIERESLLPRESLNKSFIAKSGIGFREIL